ncbi:MaoC family dehydratase [Streptomyces sp. NPDC088747]|uniref:MaoC family dehydratase n=1 Tax=Streptomyces sp. NPDC088747 TaxID=3365886 RepID=UPI0037F9A282
MHLLLARAALLSPFKRPRPDAVVPDVRLTVPGVRVDLARLAAYERVCGFATGAEAMPVTYPQVLAFPLTMRLMAGRAFPLPVLGLVHTSVEITRRCALPATGEYELSVYVEGLAPHRRGTEATVVTEARLGGGLVWESRSTYLARHTTTGAAAAPDSGGTALDSGEAAPESGKAAPESGKAALDAARTALDAGKAAPDSGKAALDAGKAASDSRETASDSRKAASDSRNTVPDSREMVPDFQETALNSRDTALNHRKTGGAAPPAPPTPPTPDSHSTPSAYSAAPLPALAEWRLAKDVGRRYGAVSGDRNPIHLYPLTARLFGYARPIAHGMWTVARCLAERPADSEPLTVRAEFKAPVLLPATVTYAAGDGRFELRGAQAEGKPTPHLTGEVRPALA